MKKLALGSSVVAMSLVMGAQSQAITLTQISTTFNSPIGIDYHEPTNSVVMSVNYASGLPHNFERVQLDGTHVQFSTASGLTEEVKIATARSVSKGGFGTFTAGDLFTGNGVDGQIARITNNGSTVLSPWVDLPGAGNGLMRGSLYVDRTGVYNGDLIVVTTGGEVWRIDQAANPTKLYDANVHLEGVITVPNDAATYGGLAGKIIAGAEGVGLLYVFDNSGLVTTYDVDVNIEDIDMISANENFFGVNFGTSRILGAPASEFTSMVGDILLTQEFRTGPSGLYRMSWDFVNNKPVATELTIDAGSAIPGQWEHVTFAPAGIREVPPTSPGPVPEPVTSTLSLIGLAGLAAKTLGRRSDA